MHWVKATTPEGVPAYVNLSAIHTMMRVGETTMLFIGGVAVATDEVEQEDGSVRRNHLPVWAKTDVRETPVQLLNLPVIEPGKAIESNPLPVAITSPVANARSVEHVAAKKKKRVKA